METNQVRLGGIYACIGGDHRYGSQLSVFVNGATTTVTMGANAPIGGMDGPGGSHPFEDRDTIVCKTNAKDIVKAIKKLIDRESPAIIKQYGKPTKNFRWLCQEPYPAQGKKGLSVAKCQEALDSLG